jgi:hypothetical protein
VALKRSGRPTTAQAAALISGGKPPEWLPRGLDRVICRVLGPAIAARRTSQGRAEVAAEIGEVAQAVEVLLNNLGGQSVVGVELAGGGLGPAMEEDEETREALLGLKARTGQALSRLRKGGRGKIEYGDDPEEICATAIVVAWHSIYGKFPPPASKTAWAVADLLWRIAGGETSTYNNLPSGLTRWRPILKRVLPPSNERTRLPPRVEIPAGSIWRALAPPSYRMNLIWRKLGRF